MKKRVLAIICAMAMASTLLVGCGGSTQEAAAPAEEKEEAAAPTEEKEEAPAEEAPAEEAPAEEAPAGGEYKIAYANKTLNNPYFVALDANLKAFCEEQGWTYTSLDAGEDIAAEQENMETFISQGYDCIIINPVDPEACIASIQAAVDAGIPVIGVDNAPDTKAPVTTTICSDNLQNGRAVGLYTAEQMGDDPIISVIISGVKGSIVGEERAQGLFCGIIEKRTGCSEEEAWEAAKAFYQELVDKGKAYNEEADFACNGQGWGNWTSDEGLPAMEDLLVANGDINLVLSENDNMLIGAMTAIQTAGKEGILLAAAADGQKEAIKLIADGTAYLATGDNNPVTVAKGAVQVIDEILNSGKTKDDYEDITRTPALCYTVENAADYYDPNAAF
ncbi:MAG: substrate-binding domain-containing protein [Lachnospiraceae bacterium]